MILFRRANFGIVIWRAAQLMLNRYGGANPWGKASPRADEPASAGDHNGTPTWRQIMAAVTQLANRTRSGEVH